MACLVNGDTFTWIIKVNNNSTITVTGVEGAVTLPAGVNFVSYSATKGSYDDGTGIWTVGGLNAGNSATLTIEVEVTDQSLQPFTSSVTVSGNEFEPYLLNNISNNQKGGACNGGCAGGFNCSDNPVSCTCGTIGVISGTCSTGSTVDYRVVEDSAVNCTPNLDSTTGHYNVVLDDYSLPWSFEWEVYCCCDEICTGPLASCEIAGQSPFPPVESLDLCGCTAEITTSSISFLVYNSDPDEITLIPTNDIDGSVVDIDWGDGNATLGHTSGTAAVHAYSTVVAPTGRVITITERTGVASAKIVVYQQDDGAFELSDGTVILLTDLDGIISNYLPGELSFRNCPGSDVADYAAGLNAGYDIGLTTPIVGTLDIFVDTNRIIHVTTYDTVVDQEITAYNAWPYHDAAKKYRASLTDTNSNLLIEFEGIITSSCSA